jgi:AraC-like DNA-binding protein
MIGTPEELTHPPPVERRMDALSDVMAAVRLSGAAFLDAEFTAPWCIVARVGPEDCRPLGPVPPRVVAYHYVIEGRLVFSIDDHPQIEAAEGDILLVPRNQAHVMGSAAGLAPVVPDDLIQPPDGGGLARLCLGGGGARTRMICGFVGCHVADNPLVATLPPVLKLSTGPASVGTWLRDAFRVALEEYGANRPGAATLLGKLSELLFVEAVRAHLTALPDGEKGWLAGLRDPVVARALGLLHARVAEPWTTERLAREVGLSRSAFAERFTALIGMPPMRYLAHWRLQLATRQLRDSRRSLAQIAWDIGYESDAAFNRAFKRVHGIAPSTWRHRVADAVA